MGVQIIGHYLLKDLTSVIAEIRNAYKIIWEYKLSIICAKE